MLAEDADEGQTISFTMLHNREVLRVLTPKDEETDVVLYVMDFAGTMSSSWQRLHGANWHNMSGLFEIF
jgi:hypothetical protein